MERNNYYVYVYCDPRKNNLPFYVGKGTGGRINDHLNETLEQTSNKRKHYKIESIRRDNLSPYVFKYADVLTEDQAYDLEDFLIIAWGRKDFDENGILFNIMSSGPRPTSLSGPNHPCWGKPSALRGKKLTPEHCEKVRQSKLGKKRKPFSEEWKRNMSLSHGRGKNHRSYGRKHSPETIKLLSQKARERQNTPESNRKRAETNRLLAKKRMMKSKIMIEVTKIQEDGITTCRGIARELNNRGFKTARNCNFCGGMVKRILTYMMEK